MTIYRNFNKFNSSSVEDVALQISDVRRLAPSGNYVPGIRNLLPKETVSVEPNNGNQISGGLFVGKTFAVAGNSHIGGELEVYSNATFDNDVVAKNNVRIEGNLTVVGDTVFNTSVVTDTEIHDRIITLGKGVQADTTLQVGLTQAGEGIGFEVDVENSHPFGEADGKGKALFAYESSNKFAANRLIAIGSENQISKDHFLELVREDEPFQVDSSHDNVLAPLMYVRDRVANVGTHSNDHEIDWDKLKGMKFVVIDDAVLEKENERFVPFDTRQPENKTLQELATGNYNFIHRHVCPNGVLPVDSKMVINVWNKTDYNVEVSLPSTTESMFHRVRRVAYPGHNMYLGERTGDDVDWTGTSSVHEKVQTVRATVSDQSKAHEIVNETTVLVTDVNKNISNVGANEVDISGALSEISVELAKETATSPDNVLDLTVLWASHYKVSLEQMIPLSLKLYDMHDNREYFNAARTDQNGEDDGNILENTNNNKALVDKNSQLNDLVLTDENALNVIRTMIDELNLVKDDPKYTSQQVRAWILSDKDSIINKLLETANVSSSSCAAISNDIVAWRDENENKLLLHEKQRQKSEAIRKSNNDVADTQITEYNDIVEVLNQIKIDLRHRGWEENGNMHSIKMVNKTETLKRKCDQHSENIIKTNSMLEAEFISRTQYYGLSNGRKEAYIEKGNQFMGEIKGQLEELNQVITDINERIHPNGTIPDLPSSYVNAKVEVEGLIEAINNVIV